MTAEPEADVLPEPGNGGGTPEPSAVPEAEVAVSAEAPEMSAEVAEAQPGEVTAAATEEPAEPAPEVPPADGAFLAAISPEDPLGPPRRVPEWAEIQREIDTLVADTAMRFARLDARLDDMHNHALAAVYAPRRTLAAA